MHPCLSSVLLPAGLLACYAAAVCPLQTPSAPAAPGTSTAPRTSGYALVADGRYLAAIDAFEAVEPKTAGIYNQLGIAAEHMYMTARAESYFEQALHMNARSGDIWNNLGTVYYGKQQYGPAEHCYRKALKLDSRNAFAAVNLGTLYFTEKKYGKGTKEYQHAYALDPNIFQQNSGNVVETTARGYGAAEQNYSLGRLFAQQGLRGAALDHLEKAVSEGFRDHRRLQHDLAFASLRDDPRFLALLQQMTAR